MKYRLRDLQIRRRRRKREAALVLADVLPVLLHISSRHRAALRRLPSRGRLTLNQITRTLFPVYWTVSRCRRNSVMWLLRPALLRRNRTVDASSSDYLIVLRASLKRVDPKQCSKWAAALDLADYYRVRPLDLRGFLTAAGGIEGAARLRAAIWKQSGGAWRPGAPPTWKRALGRTNSPKPSDRKIEQWRPPRSHD